MFFNFFIFFFVDFFKSFFLSEQNLLHDNDDDWFSCGDMKKKSVGGWW